MKKVSFLFISFISILSGLFLLFGCNNGTRPSKHNSDDVDNNKKSYLSVSGVTVSGEKTAVPVFTNDTISDFVFTLKGKTADSDTEETLGTYEGIEKLTSASIPVETGNWEFSLLAAKDGTAFTGTKEMEIIAGNNTISFVLKWDEEALSGNGNLLFSLDFSKALNKLDVMLATGELIKYNPETKEETPEYHESPLEITDFKVNYELTDVPADIYRIKIRLYADTKKKLPINTYPELAIITGGQISRAEREMDSLNSVYSISYFGDSSTEITDSSFPTKYTIITEGVTLPESLPEDYTKNGWEFKGWYTDPSFEGKAVTEIVKGNSGNKTFYAMFVPEGGFEYISGAVFDGSTTLCEGDGDRQSSVFIKDRVIPIGKLWVCNHEVTQGEYEQYCCYTGTAPSDDIYGNGPDYPVYYVSRYDAIVYCNLRSEAEGLTPCYSLNRSKDVTKWTGIKTITENGKTKYSCSYAQTISDWEEITCDWNADGYRLPTSAEWEYSARGANLTSIGQTIYSGTDGTNNDLDNYAWHRGNSDNKTHPVKGKLPNALNLYDMTGNVSEVCWDWHPEFINDLRSVRSSGFTENWELNAIGSVKFYGRYNYIGFRVVRNASFYPLLVRFDVTTNWPENTAKFDYVIIYEEGKKVTEPSYSATNGGHPFKGWYTKANPTETDSPFDFDSTITDNITLYAVWDTSFVYVEGFTFTGEETLCEGETNESKVFIKDRTIPIGNLWVSDHEVTQSEYEKYCCYLDYETKPSDSYGKGSNYPVYYVSWYDAIVYCNLRSKAEKNLTPVYKMKDKNGELTDDPTKWVDILFERFSDDVIKYGGPLDNNAAWNEVVCDWNANGYRLPTEAEWEYIARGGNGLSGTQYIYAGSDSADTVAWHYGNSSIEGTSEIISHEVKGKNPNTLGLYDLSGNVWELCWDRCNVDDDGMVLAPSATTGPYGLSSGTKRIKRGGSYTNDAVKYANVYNQNPNLPEERAKHTGFRVVRNASFHSLLVTFDTTSNWAENTAKVASVVIDEADKKVTEPAYSVKKNGYALKGWYTTANPTETDSPFNFDSSITESITLYAVWYAPASVGDVLLTDGSIISYKAGRTFTDTEKANAVGVLYGFDEEGAPMGWVAKYHTDTHTGYVWATNDVTLGGTGFESIACTRTSESNNVDEGVTFEGDLDGSDNWKKVCEADTTAESNPEKYPVFDYINKYGKDPTADYYFGGYLSETEYKDGWYLPSIAELACLFKNREKINDVLNALNEDGKPSTNTHYYSCWSSSLSQDASKCWVVTSNDWGKTGYVDEINKNSNDSYRVIPVRK